MAEWCADHLWDVETWAAHGCPLSTTSDEAAKLLDGLLRQLVSWSDCEQLGGFIKTITDMLAADPTAIMTRGFRYCLETMGTGTSARTNKVLAEQIDTVQKDAEKRGTEFEKKHIKALKLWAYGHFQAAAEAWDDLLSENPSDLIALKFAHEAYFFMGDCKGKRDSVKRVIDKWDKNHPCYSYLHGMLAFGLEECGEYKEAQTHADLALSLNRFDCWATHARAHCLLMTGRHDEGAKWMEATVPDWRPGWIIATHNYWHNAIFHIELQNYEAALTIYDQEISERAKRREVVLDCDDAASLLWRLELEGVDVGTRWTELPSMEKHAEDHVIVFNDAHLGPLYLKRGDKDSETKLHDSLVNFAGSNYNDNARVSELLGVSLLEGMTAYGRGRYDEAVEKIYPIRDQIYKIGGSHAQRDIFTQTLIHAAIRANNQEHWSLTPSLLQERNALLHDSPLGVRLERQFKTLHPL